MVQPQDEMRTAKQLGIQGAPADDLYTLREIFGDEDCPLPLYGLDKTIATRGWFQYKLIDRDGVE
jgi:hypothetical protein